MRIVRAVSELRDAVASRRASGGQVGLVPTMGAFHEGHIALMRRSRERCGFTVVSLFVNPAQFNEPSDLEQYPRDEARDAALGEQAGVDILFAPPVAAVYPAGFATTVEVHGLTERLEGAVRGTAHFRGVATVVTKLLGMVTPDVAFFGQKDAQQSLVIQRLVKDLDLDVEIEICPTVREADGLAMSSRNARLDAAGRVRATSISRALFTMEALVAAGDRSASRVLQAGRAILGAADIQPEYLVAVSADGLEDVTRLDGRVLIAVAARVGTVRLIDNVIVDSRALA